MIRFQRPMPQEALDRLCTILGALVQNLISMGEWPGEDLDAADVVALLCYQLKLPPETIVCLMGTDALEEVGFHKELGEIATYARQALAVGRNGGRFRTPLGKEDAS